MNFTDDISARLGTLLHKAMEKEIETIVAEEAVNAAARVESRVKEMTTKISARVLEKFSMSYHSPSTLRIEVDLSAIHDKR